MAQRVVPRFPELQTWRRRAACPIRRMPVPEGSQAFQLRHVANSPEIEVIGNWALKLRRVFNRNHPIVQRECRQSVETCIHERCLTTRP